MNLHLMAEIKRGRYLTGEKRLGCGALNVLLDTKVDKDIQISQKKKTLNRSLYKR